jgi:long-chain acyl-CoA synthetase
MEKKLAYKAYNAKLENYKKYGIITHTIYDQIIFKKIRAMFGNRIKAILCASAPMPKKFS